MQDKIILGDTLSFPTQVPDYLASDSWVLHYRLIQRTTGTPIELTATADGDDYLVQVAASVTATWSAGEYSWASWVAKGTEVYSLAVGTCTLVPDPRTAAAGVDLRSSARIALDNITATIQGRATSAVLEYEIGGRKLRYLSPDELIKLQSTLQAEVTREQRTADQAKGYPDKRKTYVRMASA